MDVLKDDLLEVVAATAPPLLVAAVSRLLDDYGPALTTEQAGGVIAAAICPERKFGPLGVKPLVGCEIYHGGEVVWLTPAQCVMNPGLADWTPACLAQAFMLPVETQYALTGVVSKVPVFESVGVVVGEGHCSGQLAMTFPDSGARVIAYYGQRTTGGLFASTSHAVSGDGLCALGDRLRDAVNAAEAAEQQAEARERTFQPETLH